MANHWINDQTSPSPAAILAIARVFRTTPETVLYRIVGEVRTIGEETPLNLPPNLSQGESRLVEHLAWAVRHWREEQNAARAAEDASAGSEVA